MTHFMTETLLSTLSIQEYRESKKNVYVQNPHRSRMFRWHYHPHGAPADLPADVQLLTVYETHVGSEPRSVVIPSTLVHLRRLCLQHMALRAVQGSVPQDELSISYSTLTSDFWIESLSWLQQCPKIKIEHCHVIESFPGLLAQIRTVLPQLDLVESFVDRRFINNSG